MSTATEYVQNGSFDVPLRKWAAAKKEIRNILIQKAKVPGTISYSELVNEVHAISFTPFDLRLFSILGQISTEEHEEGRPLLSVLVVHKNGDMQPGHGFFEMAESLGRDTSDLLVAWITELNLVYKYWNKPAISPSSPKKNPAAVEIGRLGGLRGGKARSEKLIPKKRSEMAKKAAKARRKSPKE